MKWLLCARRRRYIVATLLALHSTMLAWSAYHQAPTIDEPVHLAAGLHHWKTGSFELNRGNPPLANLLAAAPVLFANPALDFHSVPDSFAAGGDFLEANRSRSLWLMTLARWALIPMSLLGALVCYLWAGRIFGRGAALLVLALWCFCPFIIANGELITGDMTSAATCGAASYSFWRWLRRPGWKRAVATGAMLGVAELSKYVCVFLYPLCGGAWIAWRLCGGAKQRGVWPDVTQGACIVIISVYVINVGYMFDGSLQPLRVYRLGQTLLAKVNLQNRVPSAENAPESLPQAGWLGEIPVPLPSDYLKGIEEIQDVFKRTHSIYLRGAWLEHAPWWYFPYGLLVKMPLGTLILFLLAGAALLMNRQYSARLADELVLFIFGVGLLGLLIYTTTLPYVRYALPVIPFALIWTGRLGKAFSGGTRIMRLTVGACLTWSAVATAFVFPYCGSYFHELAGGPGEGHRQFIESSIDWGQDLLYLKDWLEKNPGARPLRLAYFGRVDPRWAGIEYTAPPRISPLVTPAAMPALEPGWYAVSISLLRGFRWQAVHDGKGGMYPIREIGEFAYLNRLPLVGRAGYSIYIFRVDDVK